MAHVAREHVNMELNEYFKEYGFNYHDDSITTSIANLIMLYIKENQIHLPIAKLLPEIFENNKINIGGWAENSYEYQDEQHFDKQSFNDYTERKLDAIIEKIEARGGK
jgi:hypothetical protein